MSVKLSEAIRTMRMSRGLTQLRLSELIGVSRSTVGMWETGEREPDLDTIEALADIFNVPMSALVSSTDDVRAEDDELMELREELRRKPEMRALFSATKSATPDQLRQAIAIIEALKKSGDT